MPVRLTLVSRAYCHLCHEMASDVQAIADEYECDIEVADVDVDPELLRLYDERVPVLLHQGEVLSQYFLDIAKVRDYLSKIR